MRIYFFLLFITLLTINIRSYAQEGIKSYVINNVKEVQSLDINYQSNDDLEWLKKSIGDSRVVMLGEQDHGDAPTFKMKARIVKYLHEEMGFDIIAFESDFYNMQKVYEKDSLNYKSAAQWIFPIWTLCKECQPALEYIEETYKTDTPLFLTGVDVFRSNIEFLDDFTNFLNENKIHFEGKDHFLGILEELLKMKQNSKISESDQEFFFEKLEIISQQYQKDDLWGQELKDLRGHAQTSWFTNLKKLSYKTNPYTHRDVQMADNLVWLAKKRFPDRKIIVWAASAHISKMALSKNHTLGKEASKILGEDLYSLGFTSYKGSTGRIHMDNYSVKEPSKNSFEQWIYPKGFEYGFVDFRGFTGKDKTFTMKGWNHYNVRLKWTQAYDGIIYIRDMYPCTKLTQ